MEREFTGYANDLPKVCWPQNARLALNFVINYEEGAEQNILDGDEHSESYLADWPGLAALSGERNLSAESLFEYGSRTGVWRLLHLFESNGIPLTFFATGLALERNLPLAQKLKISSHEVAGHGYRWINYSQLSVDLEREHIKKTLDAIEKLTEKKVSGWYTGRRSLNTRNLIVEAGLQYDSDSYSDDMPYWVQVLERPHLIIPYNLDANDARYSTCPGWSSGEDFFLYLKATFDCLYREGAGFPKMMTVGLHPRFSGRPGRSEALSHFIDYIRRFDNIWICRRNEIAEHWHRCHGVPDERIFN
jgi:peptidoglycan/xylan/chitin deacetylase (PgdA/CDA1 family)